MTKKRYRIIGLMSGTSLDGLDLAFCEFDERTKVLSYKIHSAKTIPYSAAWRKKLSSSMLLSGLELQLLHVEFGHYCGMEVKRFIRKEGLKRIDFISSHGHTVFHQTKNRMTLQIGSGAAIAAETDLPVVCDFRTMDVALGGQGAPLVPIGDKLLFNDFAMCLNLGGIANVSFDDSKSKRIAYDISPCNIPLNHLAEKRNLKYDKNGSIARKGKVDDYLLQKLNSLKYYSQKNPKSIGREWMDQNFIPWIGNADLRLEDKMRTVVEHIALQIAAVINAHTQNGNRVLLTGGGAFNTFLLERLRILSKVPLHVPDSNLVNFKEALIFAFLGLQRIQGKVNSLSSVTGARKDSCAGAIYFGSK